jgi:hypothetical protein
LLALLPPGSLQVPSPGGYSRPVHDAHRYVSALLGADRMLAQLA